ncbi:unnamed protein product [Discula destructiva]
MRIGLKQRNLHKTWAWLSAVAHPASEKYGQHWTAEEVADASTPSAETITAVKTWLSSSGIAAQRIALSQSRTWLASNATVDEAERLLKTTYHVYEHGVSGQPQIACEEYSIASHFAEQIDLIAPTVHFDAKIQPPQQEDISNRGHARRQQMQRDNKSPEKPGSGSLANSGLAIPDDGHAGEAIWDGVKRCDKYITPDCLRALYQFPLNTAAYLNTANSLGIVEYTPQAYVASDLDMFFANFTPDAAGERPIFDSIDGGFL